jgi:hypothetical protein
MKSYTIRILMIYNTVLTHIQDADILLQYSDAMNRDETKSRSSSILDHFLNVG